VPERTQSTIAAIWVIALKPTWPGDNNPSYNHVPGGGNVLYMDGHGAFIKYPGGFPICPTWACFIDEILGML